MHTYMYAYIDGKLPKLGNIWDYKRSSHHKNQHARSKRKIDQPGAWTPCGDGSRKLVTSLGNTHQLATF